MLTLEEFKESPEYNVTKFFTEKYTAIKKWFENVNPQDLEVIDYYFSSSAFRGFFIATLRLLEKEYEYTFEIIVNEEDVYQNKLTDFKMILKAYKRDGDEYIGEVQKESADNQLSYDTLTNMIAEITSINEPKDTAQ